MINPVNVRVTTVRSQNPMGFGGCIFTGRPINDRGDIIDAKVLYVIRVPGSLIKETAVEVGQWWQVNGPIKEYTRVVNGYSLREHQIEAADASLLKTSGEHIVTLLAESEAFAGIGFVKARKLWDSFGDELYDILDNGRSESLQCVLPKQIASSLIEAWAKHGNSRTLQWLHKHGFNTTLGKKVLDYFRAETPEKIEEDPYRLLSFCANWNIVDAFAKGQFNVADDDPRRLQGAVEEALYRLFGAGHTAATMRMLETHLEALLGRQSPRLKWNRIVAEAIDSGIDNGSYVINTKSGLIQPVGPMVMELTVAHAIASRIRGNGSSVLVDQAKLLSLISEYESGLNFPLTHEQKEAIKLANGNAFAVVIGGAGVGKTTVLDTLYEIYDFAGVTIHQMALSGRAAKRMSEATKREAKTIASFLKKYEERTASGERKNEFTGRNVVIIDEASMVDIITMSRVCDVLPNNVRIVMTGDASQLMPVGPGLVLHALIELPGIPIVELTSVKRYSGAIASAAQDIRNGIWPMLPEDSVESISFIHCDMKEISARVVGLFSQDPDNTQILCSRRKSHDGSKGINAACQASQTKENKPLMVWNDEFDTHAYTGFRLGDVVLCTRNRWEIGIQNGSLGTICHIEDQPRAVHNEDGDLIGYAIAMIRWDDDIARDVFEELLDDLELGYAVTVHKAQGSQWPNVIVPITKNKLLDRTLVYTAITRAQSKVIIVGDEVAARSAVEALPKSRHRNVGLGSMLSEILAGGSI